MNASTPGINVPSTKPKTRAERRAEAERIRAEQEAAETVSTPEPAPTAVESAPEQSTPPTASAAVPTDPPRKEETVPAPRTPTVQLPIKARPTKRPFATQIQASTLGRLEWVRRRGGVITDTVDAAINAYLDAAGVPPAEENGDVTE
ncbi:hypothetical protein [Nocardia aurea]|uniref:Lsr2 protein n=1 Tax=Nocardia aurea TaxID=2144174 RepID=A0ABV3G504_9NOCA